MRINAGNLDRLFRAVLGLALLCLAFLGGLALLQGGLLNYGAAILGIVMLVVAITRACPICAARSIKTCGV